jgi:hypothetical protein
VALGDGVSVAVGVSGPRVEIAGSGLTVGDGVGVAACAVLEEAVGSSVGVAVDGGVGVAVGGMVGVAVAGAGPRVAVGVAVQAVPTGASTVAVAVAVPALRSGPGVWVGLLLATGAPVAVAVAPGVLVGVGVGVAVGVAVTVAVLVAVAVGLAVGVLVPPAVLTTRGVYASTLLKPETLMPAPFEVAPPRTYRRPSRPAVAARPRRPGCIPAWVGRGARLTQPLLPAGSYSSTSASEAPLLLRPPRT